MSMGHLHFAEGSLGVVDLHIGALRLRVEEESRHGALGLVGVLHMAKKGGCQRVD